MNMWILTVAIVGLCAMTQVKADCPNITVTANIFLFCSNSTNEGSKCEIECGEGYRMMPLTEDPRQGFITCLETGNWDKDIPYCTPSEFCMPPRRSMKNGNITCTNENRISSVCNFECEEGYFLYPRDIDSNVCLSSKKWNQLAPCCTRPCPPHAKMDVFVIMDSSPSVGNVNWIIMQTFLRNVLASFIIADDATHFAVVRYNRFVDTVTQIFLNDYPNDKSGLLSAFDKLPYRGYGVRTGRAIQHVADNMMGIGNRVDARDVVIVITAGQSQDKVLEPSERLRESGTTVLVIGIKPPNEEIDMVQLLEIAGTPENILITGKIEALAGAMFAFLHKMCGNPCEN